jgi:hypothetical protein
MEINKLFERTLDVIAAPAASAMKQRILANAHTLSLAGDMQAHLDLCVSCLAEFVVVLYVTDANGKLERIDSGTNRILFRSVPWGESGWKQWGALRRWEASCLRRLLLDRVGERRRLPAMFDYNQFGKTWHVNVDSYPNAEAALRWIQKDGPAFHEWQPIVTKYREQARARMSQKRSW